MEFQTALENISRKNEILKLVENPLEFNKQVALWFVEVLDDMKPLPMPQKPEALQEYDRMDIKTKAKLKDNQDFWGSYEVVEYMKARRHAIVTNDSNHYWLCKVLNDLPDCYAGEKEMVRSAINLFNINQAFKESVKEVAWDD